MRTIEQLITEEDVFAGEKELALVDRCGKPIKLKLRGIPVRNLMRLIRDEPKEWGDLLLPACLEDAGDVERLDFESLAEAQKVANVLCLGLPMGKQMEAAAEGVAQALASSPAPAPSST